MRCFLASHVINGEFGLDYMIVQYKKGGMTTRPVAKRKEASSSVELKRQCLPPFYNSVM